MILVAVRRLVREGICSVFLSGLGGVRRQLSASRMTSPGADTETVLAPLRKAVQEQVCAATATWTFCSAPNKATIDKGCDNSLPSIRGLAHAHSLGHKIEVIIALQPKVYRYLKPASSCH